MIKVISTSKLKNKRAWKGLLQLLPRLNRLVTIGLPIQVAHGVDHIDRVDFVEIFALGDADPLVQLVQIRVVKILSFGCAAGSGFACGVWLSE